MNARALRNGVALLAVAGCVLAACSSGGGPAVCSFNDPAAVPTLTPAPWYKFRHDLQNTGTLIDAATYAAVAANPAACQWAFPPLDAGVCGSTGSAQPAKQPFVASPVLNWATAAHALSTTPPRLYIGSTDGTLYALDPTSGAQIPDFNFALTPALRSITSTALLAVRDGADAIFVGGGDETLYGLVDTGAPQATNWSPGLLSFVSASPTIGADGTVYDGALGGSFAGVCPNGVTRFALTFGGIQSSPALGPDSTTYFGTDDGQLHAQAFDGTTRWVFSASAPILAAPAVEVDGGTTTAIYVADSGGLVFKVTPQGSPFTGSTSGPCPSAFSFAPAVGPITSSPALAGTHLYFGSMDGNLYAVDSCSGKVDWTFAAGAPIESSPAVADDGGNPANRVVVIGTDDGKVYFVQDNGTSGAQLQVFDVSQNDKTCRPDSNGLSLCAVRSSPAIALQTGTVYVGADDGRVYAIGAAAP